MLDMLRGAAALLWLANLVAHSGSALRGLAGRGRETDARWAFAFFMAVHQLGYAARWRIGWAAHPEDDANMLSLIGLTLFSAMLASAILSRRIAIEGWRW